MSNRYSTASLILDLFLVFITGGLWFLWIVIKFLRSNTK